MPKIFISYRREDAQWPVDRIHAALKPHVPNPQADIFVDVDNIPAGVDFVAHLDSKVAQCDVLLAVIGPDWLGVKNPRTGQRRLDDPKDFVRIEIAAALQRGILVAPVMLDDTPVPDAADLPDDLKPLANRQAVDVRRMTFDADVQRLIRGLGLAPEPKADPKRSARTKTKTEGKGAGPLIAAGVGLLVLVVAGVGAWGWTKGWFGGATREAGQASSSTNASDDGAWIMAEAMGEQKAYEAYLRAYPQGGHATQARAALAALTDDSDWGKADGGDKAALQEYLGAHENGAHVEEANAQLTRLVEAERAAAGAVSPEARQQIFAEAQRERDALVRQGDDDLWSIASGANSAAAYNAYLNRYPQGVHAAQARAGLGALQASARPAVTGSPSQRLTAELARTRLPATTEQSDALWNRLRAVYSLSAFQAAADEGDAKAGFLLGRAYSRGLGVSQDFVKASQLYGRACTAGNQFACGNLGAFYQDGVGVTRDVARALQLNEPACAAGAWSACASLGGLYEYGIGVEQNRVRAHQFYEQACNGGIAQGCAGLGGLYARGAGVTQDYARARRFYVQACDGGYQSACTDLRKLPD
jgi:TPR repeat protein